MELPSINLDRTALSNFENAIQKEWLITNGLGGYASSTVLGLNTRKYHGLLVAAVLPPRDRRVFLAKLDEDLLLPNAVFRLGANEFQDSIFPQGYNLLSKFSVSPFPRFIYVVNDVTVQKTISMPHEKNCAITIYNLSNQASADAKIRIFPLVNWRHFHSVTERGKASEFKQEQEDTAVKINFQTPRSTLFLKATEGRYFVTDRWVERLYLREEARRGESCFDDCYQPGYFEIRIRAGETKDYALIAVAEEEEYLAAKVLSEIPTEACGLRALFDKETKQHQDFLTRFHALRPAVPPSDWLDWLVLASGSFIVKGANESERSVIAGYHWFESWGRDTFVSLPGLLLVTGRFEEARMIFLSFKKYCTHGLIPNFLPDRAGSPAYNTVDATLWYVNAVLQYLRYTGDFKFVKEELWETLKAIIENHVSGTLFNIHLDTDGLLSHGPQLTWVDSSVKGVPVTPRAGKAVEIQALWYNALKTMESLANRFQEAREAERYSKMAEKTAMSFVDKFWNSERACLYDVVSEHERDNSLRPNQVLAVGLTFTMLDNVRNEKIVEVVQRELLTPCGLRSLERRDPRYVGTYSGDRASRDRAYHNGTVWPWLLGSLTTAFLKVKGFNELQREYAFRNFLKPLLTQQVHEGGLGTLNEVFDGDQPHTPRGCISQAWSVAEPFRSYVEDILQIRPKYEEEVLHSSS
jgi:predicted glycogen debranching enzyme